MYQFNRKEYEERMKWYQDARFGMFIHWGLYSIPARGEWVRSTEEMPEEEYLPFMKEFDARDYNPKQWAKEAKAAGMKYVVLTAKHHDGFCLFDSKYTDYKVTNTPAAFAKEIRKRYPGKTIWLYTGFLWEEICKEEIVRYLDVCVDGEFEVDKKELSLKWKGSSNQRVIDVPKTLHEGKVVLHK